MGRIARIVIPQIPHHVTQRGNRRQQTFFCDQDYEVYLQFMAESCRYYGVEILAYCLMPNHVHMIAVPTAIDSLSHGIGDAHRKYTRVINHKKGWTGYLWQGRFFSVPLDESHFISAIRYVELNPIRAGMAQDPALYQWSSARAHIDGRADVLIKSSSYLSSIGDWRQFLMGEPTTNFDNLRMNTRTGRPLGDAAFIRQAKVTLSRSLHSTNAVD